jgi:hypothetical protein
MMGVVIEICVKYPGGPTRNKGTDIYIDIKGVDLRSSPLIVYYRICLIRENAIGHSPYTYGLAIHKNTSKYLESHCKKVPSLP